MINLKKELLSISKTISELAIQLETMANDINGKSMRNNPAQSSSSAKAGGNPGADGVPTTMLDTN
jgi:hypothetical protein